MEFVKFSFPYLPFIKESTKLRSLPLNASLDVLNSEGEDYSFHPKKSGPKFLTAEQKFYDSTFYTFSYVKLLLV